MDFVTNFARGWKQGSYMIEYMNTNNLEGRSYTAIDVQKSHAELSDCQTTNNRTGNIVALLPNNVTIHEFAEHFAPLNAQQKITIYVINALNWSIIVLYIIIAIVFAKIMIRFTRAKVFEAGIIRLLNHFGLWFLLLAAVISAWETGRHYFAAQMLQLDNLKIAYHNCINWDSIIIGLVILVMTEILRHATSIKEEQDLTI